LTDVAAVCRTFFFPNGRRVSDAVSAVCDPHWATPCNYLT
jgi:hypothetical protein